MRLCHLSALLALALVAEPATSETAHTGLTGCPEHGAALELAVSFLEEMNMAPTVVPCPRRVTALHLARLHFGEEGNDPTKDPVAALYVRATGEILIDAKADFMGPVDVSFLVHELVHSRQMELLQTSLCVGVLEAEAYAYQAAFLRRQALPREALMFDLMGQLQAGCASRY